MHKHIKIISTKYLTTKQKASLGNFAVDEVSLIKIQHKNKFSLPEKITHAVFTSKNGVEGLLNNISNKEISFENVYCVGDKTSYYLEKNAIEITHSENSAEELANYISKKNIEEVYFFCGNLRRNELPEILKSQDIKVNEIESYITHLNPVKLSDDFNAILFFRPSSIQSYFLKNNNSNALAFCIGKTTALEAKKHFSKVIIADKPLVESVLKSVKQYYE